MADNCNNEDERGLHCAEIIYYCESVINQLTTERRLLSLAVGDNLFTIPPSSASARAVSLECIAHTCLCIYFLYYMHFLQLYRPVPHTLN